MDIDMLLICALLLGALMLMVGGILGAIAFARSSGLRRELEWLQLRLEQLERHLTKPQAPTDAGRPEAEGAPAPPSPAPPPLPPVHTASPGRAHDRHRGL